MISDFQKSSVHVKSQEIYIADPPIVLVDLHAHVPACSVHLKELHWSLHTPCILYSSCHSYFVCHYCFIDRIFFTVEHILYFP